MAKKTNPIHNMSGIWSPDSRLYVVAYRPLGWDEGSRLTRCDIPADQRAVAFYKTARSWHSEVGHELMAGSQVHAGSITLQGLLAVLDRVQP